MTTKAVTNGYMNRPRHMRPSRLATMAGAVLLALAALWPHGSTEAAGATASGTVPLQAEPILIAQQQAPPPQVTPQRSAQQQRASTQATSPQTAPGQAGSEHTASPQLVAPMQAASQQGALPQATPPQATPTQATPPQAAPLQSAPLQSAPLQTALPQAGPTQAVRLTLAEAIALAARQNPDLLSSVRALELARSRLRESTGSRQPKIALKGSYSGATYSYGSSVPGLETPGEDAGDSTWEAGSSVGLTVSQSLPGALPAPFSVGLSPAELAAMDLTEAELDAARTKQDVTFNVISAYLNVLKAEQIRALTDGALESAANLVDEVSAKLALGVATRLDLMKAQGQFNQAKFNQLKAADDVAAAMRALALVLGLPAETKFDLVDELDETSEFLIGSSDLNQDLDRLVALALENRTEMRQANLSLERVRASADTARRALWPSVGLLAAYSRDGDVSISATGSLGLTSGQAGWTLEVESGESDGSRNPPGNPGGSASEQASVTTVGIEVSWPLWDGGIRREQLAQADTNLKMQQSALERQRQAIVEDVYGALVGLRQSLEKLKVAKSTVGEAEEALRVTKARFEAGAGVMAEVIDATQSLDSARSGMVQSVFDCYLARARLGKAVGLLGHEEWRL